MQRNSLCVVAILACAGLQAQTKADILGSARGFAVLGGSMVTSTGPTIITGNLGVWPGTAITGFYPPGIVVGTMHAGDPVAQQAQEDVTAAYNALAGMALTQTLTGTDLGGLTLTPGVYFFASSAFVTGTLTLDALGNPNATFVFRIGTTLITADHSAVLTINGADGRNVYWQVGSSATLETGTAFQGSIVALASVTLNTGATILHGRALARTGAVTMDSSTITADAGVICYPNCDNSTTPPILNANDFLCFLNRFAAGDSYANCDGSTRAPALNVLDFGCFMNRFAAGCS